MNLKRQIQTHTRHHLMEHMVRAQFNLSRYIIKINDPLDELAIRYLTLMESEFAAQMFERPNSYRFDEV